MLFQGVFAAPEALLSEAEIASVKVHLHKPPLQHLGGKGMLSDTGKLESSGGFSTSSTSRK